MTINNWTNSFVIATTFLALATSASAGLFDTEVTINDQDPFYSGSKVNEDNEAEPGMVQSQVWDLEGFFLDDTTLTMVGGYNFWKGEGSSWAGTDNDYNFSSGDLFLSVGKPLFGKSDIANGGSNGNVDVDNTFGYNYVYDLDFENNSWDLYEIDGNTDVVTSYFKNNYQSNPWQFNNVEGKDSLASGSIVGSEAITYSDAETGKDGWDGDGRHFAAGIDLSAVYAQLSEDTTLYAHFTMECGNDNLMGAMEYTYVPEPASIALFSIGLGGLFLSRRKLQKS